MTRHAARRATVGATELSAVPATQLFRHVAMGFRAAGPLVHVVAPLLIAAAQRDETVWAALDELTRTALTQRLRRAAVSGVVFADPAGDYGYSAQTTVARRAIQLRAATRVGGRATVLTQHRPGCDFHSPYWCQVEAGCNVALAGVAVTMICLYPVDAAGLLTASAGWNHPELLRGDTVRPNPGHRPAEQVLATHPTPPAPPLGDPALRLEFGPARTAALRDVRACAELFSTRAALTASRREAVAVAVSELVANSLEHGAGRGTASWWVRPGQVTVEVHDAGRMRTAVPGLRPPPPTEPRGRGLWLARRLSSTLHVWAGPAGTHVRCEI